MAFIYDVDEDASAENRKIPSVELDFRRAKKFLMKHSPESGDCLYDHLSELLEKLLSERPKNAVDIFEEYSRKIKDERFKRKSDYLRDIYVPPAQHEEAKKLMKLYKALASEIDEDEKLDVPEVDERDDDQKRRSPDIAELFFYLEHIDVALPRSEIAALDLSIRKLVAEKPIENVRFWGKIIGKPKNYFIIQAEFFPEELLERKTAEEKQNEKEKSDEEEKKNSRINENVEISQIEDTKSLKLIFPPLPKSLWKPSIEVPHEPIGSGVNRNVYYVCNSPGIDDWIELPSLTPQQIVAARKIVRMFTGDPEASIQTFPEFPGTEKNYLRAQIARITAGTHVSPIGFYTFGENPDEEDEDEAETEIDGEDDETGSTKISENRHYEPLPLKELIDPSMANWCHHTSYIFDQGRTIWWNPSQEKSPDIENETVVEEEEEEEENDDIEEENNEVTKKEVGPPLLTPLSEDARIETIDAWTARASSSIKSDYTIAIVRSNIWPGSFAFAKGKIYGNVYIGTGQKFNPYNYSPLGMPMIQEQYKIGPEVKEIKDPNVEEEEAYRIAHLPPKSQIPEIAGEESEEDEEEDDDEDDD